MTAKGDYAKTEAEYRQEISNKHGGKFEVLPMEYRGGETWIQVICPEHGQFTKKIAKMAGDKHGCAKCARAHTGRVNSIKRSGTSIPAKYVPLDEVLRRITFPEGITADFSSYISWDQGEISTFCEKHGPKTWQNAHALHQSKSRCPQCGHEKRSKAKSTSWEKFVERANRMFPNAYEYRDDYEYVDLSSYVEIICPEHGGQKMRACKHVQGGQYCSKCRYRDTLNRKGWPGFYAECVQGIRNLLQNRRGFTIFGMGTNIRSVSRSQRCD